MTEIVKTSSLKNEIFEMGLEGWLRFSSARRGRGGIPVSSTQVEKQMNSYAELGTEQAAQCRSLRGREMNSSFSRVS